ncbi:hypothetical protein [Flagellimonas onchidii]|uniref:hypothetical protein n=1 Tax=Flagellimonas onchidii TaxID=2562684 RepID=UPI0010A5AEBD|nr:hypothetical protein [Allomuricauda onchidii]
MIPIKLSKQSSVSLNVIFLFVFIAGRAQFDNFESAKIYLKNGKIIEGQAKIPLEGKTFTPNFKEKIRFKNGKDIVRYDEIAVDSIIFDTEYFFKTKINGKRIKKAIKTRDKFVYKSIGEKFPQLVKEIKVGNIVVYEKFKRLNPGGPVSGIYRFYSPHLRTNKGLTSFGHYFFCEGSDKELQPLPRTKRFIDFFSFCPSLIKTYKNFNRELHAFEIIELIKSFDDAKKCH